MDPAHRDLPGELLTALDVPDATAGLEHALELLARAGIRPVGEGADATAGAAWLEVVAGERRLRLLAPPGLIEDPGSGELSAQLRPLLWALLERARLEQTLRTERERLAMLSSASFEGLFIHASGNVIDCNARVVQMMGYPVEDLRGPQVLGRVVAPEDISVVYGHMARQTEDPYIITLVRADGTRFLAELQAKTGQLGDRPVRVVAVRDVTERERQASLLREQEARLRALAEAVFDFFVHSVDGTIVDVGGDYERVTGYSREELVGRSTIEFIALPARDKARHMVETQSSAPYESLLIAEGGQLVPVEIVGARSTYAGKEARFTGLRDLSEVRRLEAERRELHARMERGQRLESLGVLAGGVAHDFNNILLGILGHAELLGMQLSDEQALASVDTIRLAAERAAKLTRQLLAYAGQRRTTTGSVVDMGEMVGELRTLLGGSFPRQARVQLKIAEGCRVLGDPTTLGQVLMNLLTNAADSLGGEPGEIEVRVEPVRDPGAEWDDAVGATIGPGQWVRVSVRDTGAGMDERTRSRIFEPFFSTKEAGHGLGLAACLGILRAHGGAIRVETEAGVGSRFEMLLPAHEGNAPSVRPASPESVDTEPCRVLVIDDEAVVRSQLSRLLSLRGFVVHEAPDGEAGVNAHAELSPELVILDLALPGIDGIEVARRIREQDTHTPILLSSGYLDERTAAKLEGGLVQGFLAKPYSLTDLLQAIDAARGAASAAD